MKLSGSELKSGEVEKKIIRKDDNNNNNTNNSNEKRTSVFSICFVEVLCMHCGIYLTSQRLVE